ncbi:hypothetical protein B0A54_01176 [Friedmanniomyces endolithicus]|uniref:Heterokaryon incompatibility domain-containing protein n=1 Tax=Friedmanniomyces endolithicus TaxID=329885 RepID=A0A4U0VIM6_9PEZI|nr:hypothetical protein LTS01_001429 [Friedmanniomyces endolithicus]TKA49100.1 hypothetical protein B0A54_01176 [Friedmanniomyces endolithicus]
MNLTRWKSPPQIHEDTPDFRYGLLQSTKTGIRLAQILPGSGNKGIAIKLIDSHVTGRDRTTYDALSYTWGDGARTKFIICNGRRLAVTSTLLEALQRFRDRSRVVTLWSDQICICQERVKERNNQVQMMGEIYRSARKVVVWLGEHYDDSKAGMQLADQLRNILRYRHFDDLRFCDLDAYGLPGRGHKKWKALAAVLRRPWFWRTWVVQEVVLNPNVEIVLGANMLTWEDLEGIVALLEGPIPKIWQVDQVFSIAELPFSRINRIRLRHRRLITSPTTPALPSTTFTTAWTEEPRILLEDDQADDPELLDLLLMSRGLGTTDPRDKVYALLGLGKHDIVPDYQTSPEDVFLEFAQHQIGSVTDIRSRKEQLGVEMGVNEREVRRAMVMLSCAGRQNQQRKLPSWVPDWTVNLGSRPLIFGLGKRYSAGGSKLGMLDYDFDVGLQLSGILLDTVHHVGSVLLDLDVPGDPHTLITEWWREAQQIAFERIARSPGSTLYLDAFEAMRRRLQLCKHGYYLDENRTQRRNSFLDDADLVPDAAHNVVQTLTLGPTRGRNMFASSTGYLGLVPHGTREGDVVFVVRGADVPYVLRQYEGGYELIGEAYVQGIMEGEGLGMSGLLTQDIVLR